MDDWNTWKISSDERFKHDERFHFLRPVNGYVTGEQAREFFTQSKLPTPVLAKIWALADITADGMLDKKEFSIAMFLIKKCIEGSTLPMHLPPSLLKEPQRFIPSSSLDPLLSATVARSNSSPGTADSGEWSISATSRPKYKLQFNQNDRNKRGYLTGVEARGVFLKSNLPQSQLALIWNLADIDKDGNLTCDEFCIAAYLIDQALAGRKLPTTLPPSLLPISYTQQSDASKSTAVASEHKDEGRVTFEDKRMQNFLLGQAELDKRKQDLAEQLRQEEEQRREHARFEAEKQEKLRLEKERERQKQAEMEAERQRALEARRQQAATARLQAVREELRRRAIEAEKARLEALLKERAKEAQALEQAKAHRASLQEAAGSQTTRRQAVQTRFEVAQAEVDAHKVAIRELAGKRDAVERECRDLTEHVEAAKAELHRWQREYEQLQSQVATSVDISHTSEQQKTLRANLKQANDSKRQLELQLSELEAEVTQGGQTLASHRHQAQELAKRRSVLITEMRALLATLLERRRTLREKRKSTTTSTNSVTSTSLAAGPSEPYIALYAYAPTRPDELPFAEHDHIQIFTNPPFEVCEGWLYGEMGGRHGLVPATYVRKISDGEVAVGLNSTPASQVPSDPFALPASTAENPASNPFPAFETPAQQPNSLPLSDDAPVERAVVGGEKPLFTCLALYNFDAIHPGDLSLQINDKVDVFIDNSGWYEGVSRRTGQRGIFPANHVQKLQPDTEMPSTSTAAQPSAFTILATVADTTKTTPPGSAPATSTPSAVKGDKPVEEGTPKRPIDDHEEDEAEAVITVSDTPELAVALTPFTAQSSEQLSLAVGQYVKILKRSSKGWWEGETQQRGQDRQIGWFPCGYVRLVNANTNVPNVEQSPIHHAGQSSKNAQPPTAAQGSSSSTQGVVSPAGEPQQSSSATVVTADLSSASIVQSMFAYKASQPDELTFPEGALIEVLAHEEEGWWRGRIQSNGVEGLFPVNYVKPYAKPTDATTSSPSANASSSGP